jgi:hypothetical protein
MPRDIKSVIVACRSTELTLKSGEPFCIEEGFPTSGNDKQNKNLDPSNRAVKNSLV